MRRHMDKDRRCAPVEAWPELDRAAWARALEPADPLDDEVGYARRRWKPATITMIESSYGRWLNWLERTGQLEPGMAPVERATLERVRAYFASLTEQGLADYTKSRLVQQLGNALKAMDPACDVSRISRAASRLHNDAKPSRNIAARLQPAEEVEKLGFDMMHAADHDRFRTASERAVLYRDGLLIAFLVHRPLRRKNLAAIDLGSRLQKRGDGWFLSFPEGEVKNGERIDATWPECLVPALERYLDVHRPVLLAGRKDPGPQHGLWVALGGSAMGASAIEFQICRRTEEEFGTAINPHSFRHLTATTMATFDPENVQAAAAVLGHGSTRTTQKHYNKAKMVDAGRRYHEALGQQKGRRKGTR